ncbi:MAG TPA: thiamine-phosphate kinase [Ktedonobacterales bacterium]|nr:thiamine-phosphate kinase [Ktedonobacterales bacterium]
MSATPRDEFDLIARLTANLPGHPDVRVGIGDDAAIVRWPADRELVVTCDAQVAGRHFLPESASPEIFGARAMAVNLSDIAAMGGEPRYALVSLLIPPETTTDWLMRYYGGLRATADTFAVAIIGGNLSGTTGPFTADVTLFGQIAPGRAIRRSGARVGDAILVTGQLGAAAAGLLAESDAGAASQASQAALAHVRDVWLHPTPRVSAGQALAAAGCATAMIDVSDGLAADLGHILQQSHVGALLEAAALPVDAATRAVARALGRAPDDLALFGGDDYELLFTVPAEQVPAAMASVTAIGATATRIGTISDHHEGSRLRVASGAIVPLEPRGWDHLRAEGLPRASSARRNHPSSGPQHDDKQG